VLRLTSEGLACSDRAMHEPQVHQGAAASDPHRPLTALEEAAEHAARRRAGEEGGMRAGVCACLCASVSARHVQGSWLHCSQHMLGAMGAASPPALTWQRQDQDYISFGLLFLWPACPCFASSAPYPPWPPPRSPSPSLWHASPAPCMQPMPLAPLSCPHSPAAACCHACARRPLQRVLRAAGRPGGPPAPPPAGDAALPLPRPACRI
jgi:hypothetical protein